MEQTLDAILRTLSPKQLRYLAMRINCDTDAEAGKRLHISASTIYQWENKADVDAALQMMLTDSLAVARETLARAAGEAALALIDDLHAKRHGEIRQSAAKDLLNRLGLKAPDKMALTDPSGEHEYRGLSDTELNREIAAALARALGDDANGATLPLDDARPAGAIDPAG